MRIFPSLGETAIDRGRLSAVIVTREINMSDFIGLTRSSSAAASEGAAGDLL